MKQQLLSAAIVAAVIGGAVACISLDENLITGVSAAYYATPDGLPSALNAAYGQLRGLYGQEYHVQLEFVGTDMWNNADQATTGSNPGTNKDFDQYNAVVSSTSGSFASLWNASYSMINSLNTAIDRGTATTGIPQAQKDRLLAEAHFLRAQRYFELTKQFGDVTLQLHENLGVVVEASRAPQADVYKSILADLDTAVTSLPNTTSDVGRATKAAALHLRSKVYLTRAYKSFSPSKTADFNAALSDAKAVIALGTSTLEPVYADLWCKARLPADVGRRGYCEGTGYNGNPKEFIFTIQYSNQQSASANNFSPYFLSNYDGGPAWLGTPRDLNNGRPFRRLMPTNHEQAIFRQNHYVGVPSPTGSDILDTRWDATFQTWWATTSAVKNTTGGCPACTNGAQLQIGDTTGVMYDFQVSNAYRATRPYQIVTMCPAGDADETVYCGENTNAKNGYFTERLYPSLKKYQDNTRAVLSDQAGYKTINVYRLGETYLLAAEADVNLGLYAEAAAMINVLRVRAAAPAHKADGLNTVTPAYIQAYPNLTAGTAPGLDFVMEEREREMAGEDSGRWSDLTRVGAQYFVDHVKKYNAHSAGLVALKHALRAIPQSQIDGVTAGDKYPQNVGY
ncbi:MAG: RagB/SusD family nutrient uptake outer membrane protein [Gemmatimonadota bacterium]